MISPRPIAAVLTAATLLLAGCSHGVRLSDGDRAALRSEPVIHVLHYETALPTVKANGTEPAPSPAALRRVAGTDPAALIAASLSRLLGRTHKLKNLKVEPQHLPRPVAISAAEHRPKYRRGLALELWLDTWSFEAVAGSPAYVAMRSEGRARLSRIEDGRALWSTGRCRVDGTANRDYRIRVADLRNAAKLRKLLAAARHECARQLVRDFDTSPDKKG
jgi:hypothetical protein